MKKEIEELIKELFEEKQKHTLISAKLSVQGKDNIAQEGMIIAFVFCIERLKKILENDKRNVCVEDEK